MYKTQPYGTYYYYQTIGDDTIWLLLKCKQFRPELIKRIIKNLEITVEEKDMIKEKLIKQLINLILKLVSILVIDFI